MDSELLVAASHGQHKHLTRLIAREVQVAAAAASWRPTTTTTSVVDVASSPASIVVEIDGGGATTTTTTDAIIPILEGVTPDGDSALHVVAASGDAETYLESAKVIHGKAGHLLCSRNRGGRTPLHRAARAGNVEMISLLIRLAVSGDGGEGETTRVETIVRMTNGGGETVLHEAIRVDDTRARTRGWHVTTSPLFLAVALCRYGLAQELHRRDNQLSYSGPAGQNALHAAVLRNKGTQ
nr:unnamed protein product [Digitaria exilis]